MGEQQNWRARNVKFLLYPEDETHVSALDYIKANFAYVGILHDKDKNEDGTLKKPHWHIMVMFPNDRFCNAIAKRLKITPNYIRRVEDKNRFARYLVHLDNADKYQYPLDELFGNSIEMFDFTVGGTGEVDKMIALIDEWEKYVDSGNYLSYRQAIKMSRNNHSYDVLRRSGALGTSVIKELQRLSNLRNSNPAKYRNIDVDL